MTLTYEQVREAQECFHRHGVNFNDDAVVYFSCDDLRYNLAVRLCGAQKNFFYGVKKRFARRRMHAYFSLT